MPNPDPSSSRFAPLWRRWLPWLLSALVIILMIGFTVRWTVLDSTPSFNLHVQTHPNETRVLPLPDGSTVMVNRATVLAIAYFLRRREVMLRNGEAFFKVRWQYRTAFNVRVGAVEVNIVGTRVQEPDAAFTVRTDGNMVRVQVQQGSIKVLTATAGPREFVEMQAGDALHIAQDKRQHVLTRVDPATLADWARQ